MLAAITKTQELAIDQTEANMLATGIANVSRHYDFAATQKSIDWANLLMVAGTIYGTRIYAIRAKRPPRPTKPNNPAPGATVTESVIPSGNGVIFDPSLMQ